MAPDGLENKTERELILVINARLIALEQRVDRIDCKLDRKYVTHEEIKGHLERCEHCEEVFITRREFAPVAKIVYGATGAVMLAVLTAILALVLSHA